MYNFEIVFKKDNMFIEGVCISYKIKNNVIIYTRKEDVLIVNLDEVLYIKNSN